MIIKTETETLHKAQFMLQDRVVKTALLILLFISAFGIRMYHITNPPMDFAALRQYQSAHIARGYYFDRLESIPEWKKQIAEINMKRMGLLLEPRIMENLTVMSYKVMKDERLWVPRVFSSIFWIIGGIFLYLIATKISSPGAALFSTVFYLFMPFSILASRSFQPDPLMVMMLLISIFAIVNYHEKPSLFKLVTTSIISAIAILVKPYSLFFIFGAYVSSVIYKHGIRKLISSLEFYIFSVICFLPTAVYYLHGILTNVGYLSELSQGSFLPHLIMYPYFWKDWLYMISRVVGYIAFIGAICGFFMMRSRYSKAILSGLWVGYLVFGMVFTVHIHTHDYYHLPFLPVVALSVGPLGASILDKVRRRWKVTVTGLIILSLLTGAFISQINLNEFISNRKNTLKVVAGFLGINDQIKGFIADDFDRQIRIFEEIGDIVEHSDNTVLLTEHFGRILAYHGELSGLPWPTAASLRERKERGLRELNKEELFNKNYLTIRTHGKYIKYTPDYFIITDFSEYSEQTDLKHFLVNNFPIIAKTDDYLIFDLRIMSG